jgi:hypothetical protein
MGDVGVHRLAHHGIAKLSHNDELAQGMIRSLKWKILRFR